MGWGGSRSRFPAPTVRPEIAQGKRGFASDALGNRPPTAKALKGRDSSGDPVKSRRGNADVVFYVGPSGLGDFPKITQGGARRASLALGYLRAPPWGSGGLLSGST